MYKERVSPILDRLDSETWHVKAREMLHWAEKSPLGLRVVEQIANGGRRFTDGRLRVVLGGIQLDNPVMVGAGWDKQGRAIRGLHAMDFSAIEVGSVLAYPQPGNDKPRQWMIGPGVSFNRLGFNSPGDGEVRFNLKKYGESGITIGISIGKNKDVSVHDAPTAHAMVAQRLYDYASYFVINVSSPNTPGLRELQDKKPLTDIVQAVNYTMEDRGGRKPLFVKIAPELTNEAIEDVIGVVVDNGLTGIIATNTTTNPNIKAKYGESWRNEMGGLAGDDADYRKMATDKVAHIYKEAGDKIEIIGVGGVKNAETARDKILAGAKAVQVVTAIRGEGPSVASNINKGLLDFMRREGIKNLEEIRGQKL